MADHSNNIIFLIRVDFLKTLHFLSLLHVNLITMDDNQNMEENVSEDSSLLQTLAFLPLVKGQVSNSTSLSLLLTSSSSILSLLRALNMTWWSMCTNNILIWQFGVTFYIR